MQVTTGPPPAQTRVKTAKTELPGWVPSLWDPPPAAASSASKRVPLTPLLAKQRQGRENKQDDPNPGPVGT